MIIGFGMVTGTFIPKGLTKLILGFNDFIFVNIIKRRKVKCF